ncbi:hypothetical protein TRFO_16035 [Tritrichomonas foetus]|uniref:General transcription factor IIH subunit 3 n=1 Tax=Tritrichomonas foetus TaxID=1144522 RepID=A0A1J4KR38_9EUKA|nr:hypothetical protein TRFO_16035 [Tritrichomonas foetus]|eukprot:OHT13715.1 hypothetical protein TRFO_16035 [Tritrichomonas foetus]
MVNLISKKKMADREVVLFLIDTNPVAWNKLEEEGVRFTDILSQLYAYLTQMILSDVFQLAPIIAYNQCGVHWLFPAPEQAESLINGNLQVTNSDEILSYCNSINKNLCDFANQCSTAEQKTNDVRLDVAISTALCHLNRYPKEFMKRIFVITPSKDSESSFESTMNAIFAAHRINVTIDSVLINISESLFLNQAAILTNGFTISVKNRLKYLLQYFLSIPPLPVRNLMVLKKVKAIDYKTPSVNTKELIDQGLMCPICLSVYQKTDKPLNTCKVCKSYQQLLT